MSSEIRENYSEFQKISHGDEDRSMPSLKETKIEQIFARLQKNFVWFSSLTEQTNYCSENISSVIGYTSEEIKSFNEKRLAISFREDIPRLRVALNDFLVDDSLTSIQLVYRIDCKDKNTIHAAEQIYADRDEKGEVIKLYGIVSDITKEKETEERLFETISDLQKLNETKDKFVSRISHDLRSPFTSIIGFAEVLINDSQIPENEKLEYLSFILKSSRNLLHFVNQLNEIIKLQTHRTKLEPQRTNVNRLIHYSVSSFTAQIVDKGLEVKVSVDESVHINADERLFLALIACLMSNAVKFSKLGGKININANEFNDDFVEIIVKDEGVGISEKNKAKLFKIDQMFFSEGTKGEKGAGLGLLLSKEIVEKHGGNIWLYSNQNEGTEVHFTIPVSKNTILVVENNETERSGIVELIKNNFSGFDILSASDAYDALDKLVNKIPSLIILNHDLPLMNGLQMLDTIFKANRNSNIHVIVFIENTSAEVVKLYENFGVKMILPKPISLKVLNKKIEEQIKLKL